VAVDVSGNVFVADTDNYTIRRITSAGVVTTLAGQASVRGSADGTATVARFNGPSGLALDATGNLYVADTLNHTLRKITAAGVVSTFAGSAGTAGTTDGTGTAARFFGPQGLAADSGGNLYVADTNNQTIRKIVLSTGAVTTVAGLAGASGSTDAPGNMARFLYPTAVTVDGAGNLYVADTDNYIIRQITSAGVVSTVAGQAGASGSVDGVGNAARFNYPSGIAADSSGNLYIADTDNQTIRLGIFPAAPAITAQPQNQTVPAGSNVQFSVTATGKPAPTYQWFFNGTAISGATSSSYSPTSVQSTNAGDYTVTVSNSSGSVTSSAATLTVNAAPNPTLSSGSGGGGTMEPWFIFALLSLILGRGMALHRRR
jgi:sugar lactone lactonase YvrE